MTLAGNSLSFSDVLKAYKPYADEFFARSEGARRAHVAHSLCDTGKKARVTAEEQKGDTDVETALAALNEDNDTDLEETDVQEILLAYKESRQLHGEQQVDRGYRPVTGVSMAETLSLRVDSTSRN